MKPDNVDQYVIDVFEILDDSDSDISGSEHSIETISAESDCESISTESDCESISEHSDSESEYSISFLEDTEEHFAENVSKYFAYVNFRDHILSIKLLDNIDFIDPGTTMRELNIVSGLLNKMENSFLSHY